MTKAGVLVMGPAGSGKSTFCNALVTNIRLAKRSGYLVNLDPAAEKFEDLITLEDAMQELDLGPNGGLLYCFEYLLNNMDWLDDSLGDYHDDFLVFDLPGQIELYTHEPLLPRLISHLTQANSFRLCAIYLLESHFIVDTSKYFAGVLSAISAMLMLEIPHLNVLSKIDLIKDQYTKADIKQFLRADTQSLMNNINFEMNPKYQRLNEAIVRLIGDFDIVSFLPLESSNEKSVAAILSHIDNATQWLEDQESKEPPENE